MVYYDDGIIKVRSLELSDAEVLAAGDVRKGYEFAFSRYTGRYKDSAVGLCVSLVTEYNNYVAGYISVYPNSQWGSFANTGHPELIDFAVLEQYRNNGVGNKLMDVAEQIAAEYSDRVYLGVGLNSSYGSAQRLYVKRGYIPDGKGVWYEDRICEVGRMCYNDDDLVLYLSKKLK